MEIYAYIIDCPSPTYRFAASVTGGAALAWIGQGVSPQEAVRDCANQIIEANNPRVRSAPGFEDVAWSAPAPYPSARQVQCARDTLESLARGEKPTVNGYATVEAAEAEAARQVRSIHGAG